MDGANEEGTEYKGVDLEPLFSSLAIREYSLVTLAPIFPKGASFADLKSNYLAGLRRMMECDRTGGDEPFYTTLTEVLSRASSAPELHSGLDQFAYKPQGEFEKQILSCLKLALGGVAERSR